MNETTDIKKRTLGAVRSERRTCAVMIWCGVPIACPNVSIPRRDESVERVEGEEGLLELGSGIGWAAMVCKTAL